jgi:hypothetical protein
MGNVMFNMGNLTFNIVLALAAFIGSFSCLRRQHQAEAATEEMARAHREVLGEIQHVLAKIVVTSTASTTSFPKPRSRRLGRSPRSSSERLMRSSSSLGASGTAESRSSTMHRPPECPGRLAGPPESLRTNRRSP